MLLIGTRHAVAKNPAAVEMEFCATKTKKEYTSRHFKPEVMF